jgi:glutathione S-transferase
VLVVHQYRISPFCDKIRRILHYKGVAYEVAEVPPSRTPWVRRKNPAGKLPFIEHDGKVVGDSTNIAHYLEEVFPEPPILPPGARQRALVHLFEDWADESLYFYEMRLRFTLPHNAERWLPELMWKESAAVRALTTPLVPKLIGRQLNSQGLGRKSLDTVLGDLDRHLDALAGWLDDAPWLVGDRLSLADIAVYSQLHCIDGTSEGSERIRARRPLATWMESVARATDAPA